MINQRTKSNLHFHNMVARLSALAKVWKWKWVCEVHNDAIRTAFQMSSSSPICVVHLTLKQLQGAMLLQHCLKFCSTLSITTLAQPKGKTLCVPAK